MNRLTRKSQNSEMVWFIDRNNFNLEPCEMTSGDSGMAIRKLAYYEEAEECGKLLVIPCKVGDTIYDIYESVNNKGFEDGAINELKVTEIHINLDKRNRPWLIISGYMFAFEDFGKTVFFSREEAEEALKNQ